jgi:hypothetical protein
MFCKHFCKHFHYFSQASGVVQIGARRVDAHGICGHSDAVSKIKKVKLAESAPTPGTIMGEKIRARANKLSDTEREALMGDAMRIVYGSQGDAARAHRR